MSVFVKIFDGTHFCCPLELFSYSSTDLRAFICHEKHLPSEDIHVLRNGKPLQDGERLEPDATYQVILGLKGGKGGFGAMLRMIGAQIEKTTNREACRDLSGRRMRDVNNEKNLQSWIEKKKQQEEERERKRREKLERMRSRPKHFFVDPSYDKQKEAVTESLEEAVSKGIEAAGSSGASASGVKRAVPEDSDSDDDVEDVTIKKQCMWLGVEGIDEDGSDNEDDDDDNDDVRTEGAIEPREGGESKKEAMEESSSSSSPVTSESRPEEQTSSETSPEVSSVEEVTKGHCSTPSENDAAQNSSSSVTTEPGTCNIPRSSGPVDLESVSSVAELEELGLDRLKNMLMEKGMKCGGTLQERAQRLFSVKGLDPSHIDPSLLAKPGKKGKKGKK
ncbi:splicing regulator SDE2-like [Diadema antillarum]|uniref:splicing regulator SDE2-like n=1 Tax=Diadema antillarum TaxID=105358 RepID=UPI003A8C79A1